MPTVILSGKGYNSMCCVFLLTRGVKGKLKLFVLLVIIRVSGFLS